MKPVEFEVKLFDTESLAADGSNIPRRSCEAYITGPDYPIIIRDRVSIGGLTHKDRKLRPELKGLVGMDDQVLINDNALFYITKLFFKEGDNFFYARARTFDPELFAGKRAENIYNLIGMLKSGVRMPVSVVIQALWSKRGTAEKIIRIKGFDFTQNPSFKGAGDIKVFSQTIEDKQIVATEEELRQYSESEEYKDCELRTVIFSTEGSTVSVKDDDSIIKDEEFFGRILADKTKTYTTYSEVVSMYGQSSPQVKVISAYQGKQISHDELKKLAQTRKDGGDQDNSSLDYFYNSMKQLTAEGDRGKLQNLFRSNRDKLQNIVHSVPKDDPNRNELIQTRINNFFRTLPNDEGTLQVFSSIASIDSRLRNQEQPRYTKINRIVKSYQQIKDQKKLKDVKLLQTKLLFLQDLNLLIKEVLPEIKKGRSLDSLYALGRYGKEVKLAADQLSKTYRKLLIAQDILKFVPKGLQGEWMIDMRNFYRQMSLYTLGSAVDDLELNLIDIK